MANEITVLQGDGGERYSFVFGFPIASPKQIGGSNIVVTPSADLPAIAATVFAQADKDALDAGTAAFEVASMSRDPSLTLADFKAAVQGYYARRQAAFNAAYASKYEYAGLQINAV